ncbi:hypothetical protein [Bradyrhizobium sp. STM 3561]|uniref:hypothetical protein n=1 Tax=Bradyrhizobium sp. STM 3561 TaxID=578923 RepID=UPI00388DF783
MGRRDYANLLLLAKLGLWANEVATLTLDDIDWRASEILRSRQGPPARTDADTQTLAWPSLHICGVAAQSRRADGCSSAHSRRTSGLFRMRSP